MYSHQPIRHDSPQQWIQRCNLQMNRINESAKNWKGKSYSRQIQHFHMYIFVGVQRLGNTFFDFSGQCLINGTIVIAILFQKFHIFYLQSSIQCIGHCKDKRQLLEQKNERRNSHLFTINHLGRLLGRILTFIPSFASGPTEYTGTICVLIELTRFNWLIFTANHTSCSKRML